MGKPLKPAWRETPILYGEDARRFMKRMEIAAVILLQMSFEVLLFFLFISFFITTAKYKKYMKRKQPLNLTCFYSVSYDKNGNLSFLKTRSTVGGTRTLG